MTPQPFTSIGEAKFGHTEKEKTPSKKAQSQKEAKAARETY